MLSVWLSPFAVHLKLSQHYLLISYTQYKFKVFFFFLKEPQQPWGEGLQVSGMAGAKAWSEEWRGACVKDGGKDVRWGPRQSPTWAGTAGIESHVLLGTTRSHWALDMNPVLSSKALWVSLGCSAQEAGKSVVEAGRPWGGCCAGRDGGAGPGVAVGRNGAQVRQQSQQDELMTGYGGRGT